MLIFSVCGWWRRARMSAKWGPDRSVSSRWDVYRCTNAQIGVGSRLTAYMCTRLDSVRLCWYALCRMTLELMLARLEIVICVEAMDIWLHATSYLLSNSLKCRLYSIAIGWRVKTGKIHTHSANRYRVSWKSRIVKHVKHIHSSLWPILMVKGLDNKHFECECLVNDGSLVQDKTLQLPSNIAIVSNVSCIRRRVAFVLFFCKLTWRYFITYIALSKPKFIFFSRTLPIQVNTSLVTCVSYPEAAWRRLGDEVVTLIDKQDQTEAVDFSGNARHQIWLSSNDNDI